MPHMLDLMAKADRPIQFYGKVIDQNGNPIPDVKVALSIKLLKVPKPEAIPADLFDGYSLTTDADGLFSLTDAKGELLTVDSLQKDGYEAAHTNINRGYWYWASPGAEYVPNSSQPETFQMWKETGAEKLIASSFGTGLRTNGTPIYYDLFTGSNSPSRGDLKIWLDRNPQEIKWGQRNYDWSITIEATSGGILASDDAQMYLAPEDGYQPQLVINMPANAPGWTNQMNAQFYFRIRGGKDYGRAQVQFMVGSDRQITPFSMTTNVNPSGSRNLEPPPPSPPPPPSTNPVQQPVIREGQVGP
jgi:hypothetical protein